MPPAKSNCLLEYALKTNENRYGTVIPSDNDLGASTPSSLFPPSRLPWWFFTSPVVEIASLKTCACSLTHMTCLYCPCHLVSLEYQSESSDRRDFLFW
ncbi:hypothetical protein V6N12_065237 [Hibiscus sabdariffa]|uniref:Uncharacterized protein n=1 Tax=Hibiscus sabdariffa TaxID=183260 RepID=A0ABR2G8B8_9ROSI